MKARQAAALALVGCLLSSRLSWAQSHSSELKTFTAPDGDFSFSYTGLIDCERNRQATDDSRFCFAYLCDDMVNEGDLKSVACFAYPRNRLTDTPAYQGGTFSVEVVKGSATEKSCLAPKIPDQFDERLGSATIHGVSFEVLSYQNPGAGSRSAEEGRVYRAFHRGKCYQLGISRGYANVADYDPLPVEQLSDAADREVDSRLDRALKSFRFLK